MDDFFEEYGGFLILLLIGIGICAAFLKIISMF